MTASRSTAQSTCHACRKKFDTGRMLRGSGSTLYCSKGCLVHEQWVFSSIPLPRKGE